MSIEISEESQEVKAWKEGFSPSERAAQYAVAFSLMIAPEKGSYESVRHLVPVLRYGVHSDVEAKRFIADHPEIFGGFKLDYYWMLDSAIEMNYLVAGTSREDQKSIEEQVAHQKHWEMSGSQKEDDVRRDIIAPETEMGPMGRRVVEPKPYADQLVPVDMWRQDLRPYMPYEEELGMNIWPMVAGITVLTAGLFAVPMLTGVSVSGLVSIGMARVAAGLAPVAAWLPTAEKTLEGGYTYSGRAIMLAGWGTRLGTQTAATGLVASIYWNYNHPEEAQRYADEAKQQADEQIQANATTQAALDDLAERGNIVVSGEATPEGVDPVEQSHIYTREAETMWGNSSAFPSASIETQEPESSRLGAEITFGSLPDFTPRDGAPTVFGEDTGVEGETAPIGEMSQTATDFEAEAVTWMQENQGELYEWYVGKYGVEEAVRQAVLMYPDNADRIAPAEPTPFVGQGWQGSPIERPTQDPATGEWSAPSYMIPRELGPGARTVQSMMPYTDAADFRTAQAGPRPPRYDQKDFSTIIGNMTVGQIETFVEKGILAGVIDEEYVGTGLMDGTITYAMEQVMYQANLSGDMWNTVLDKMVVAFQEAKEAAKEDRLNEYYNNFVPSTPYFKMDQDTINQAVKQTMRNMLGREANQWEIDLMTGDMRTDHRAAYDEKIEAERAVYNAVGRAEEYDEPQSVTGTYEDVDEEAGFAERFEERYSTEIGQMERHERMEQDSKNLFGSLSRLSQIGGGV